MLTPNETEGAPQTISVPGSINSEGQFWNKGSASDVCLKDAAEGILALERLAASHRWDKAGGVKYVHIPSDRVRCPSIEAVLRTTKN